MAAPSPAPSPTLPPDLEAIFAAHANDADALFAAFMPAFCHHLKADRVFLQPRNPLTRVCKVLRWRRHGDIPWPSFPGIVPEQWFREAHWEDDDPLWRAALAFKPSIYIEDLETAANEGVLSLDFEQTYMGHTAFVHGHAHWPALGEGGERQFYGSVQPAVFGGPRVWSEEDRRLVEMCLVRIAPIMKIYGERAPVL